MSALRVWQQYRPEVHCAFTFPTQSYQFVSMISLSLDGASSTVPTDFWAVTTWPACYALSATLSAAVPSVTGLPPTHGQAAKSRPRTSTGNAKTLYSSPLPQMFHWDNHNHNCQKLKSQERLQKGAKVLRRLWHPFRASTFASKLDK
jgi:hypothetical protein